MNYTFDISDIKVLEDFNTSKEYVIYLRRTYFILLKNIEELFEESRKIEKIRNHILNLLNYNDDESSDDESDESITDENITDENITDDNITDESITEDDIITIDGIISEDYSIIKDDEKNNTEDRTFIDFTSEYETYDNNKSEDNTQDNYPDDDKLVPNISEVFINDKFKDFINDKSDDDKLAYTKLNSIDFMLSSIII